MKKLLFITTQLPYPPISGGVIKSFKLIEFLSKHFEITLACPLKNNDADYVNKFKEKGLVREIVSEPITVKRSLLSLFKSYICASTLNVFRNQSKLIERFIQNKHEQFDIILADHYEVYPYIPQQYKGLKVLHAHNAEYVMWDRMGRVELNILKKALIKLEAWRIKKAETGFCKGADLIFAAPNDIEKLGFAGVDNTKFRTTLHLGDDSALQKNVSPGLSSKAIMYVGTLSWEANIDGLLTFLKEVWPLIVQKHPETKLYLIGKNPDNRLMEAAKSDKNIIFTGFVEDFSSYISLCRLAIAPLRFGSGTKVKVLTYLYHGMPIVTTDIGVEGLVLENGKHAFIANNKHEFLKYCLQLLEEDVLCKEMSIQAKEIGLSKYSWKPMLDRHLQEINEALMHHSSKK